MTINEFDRYNLAKNYVVNTFQNKVFSTIDEIAEFHAYVLELRNLDHELCYGYGMSMQTLHELYTTTLANNKELYRKWNNLPASTCSNMARKYREIARNLLRTIASN